MADAAVTTTDVAGLLSCSCFAAAAAMATASALAADAVTKADAAPLSGFYLSFAAAVAADSNPSTTRRQRYRIAASAFAMPKLPSFSRMPLQENGAAAKNTV